MHDIQEVKNRLKTMQGTGKSKFCWIIADDGKCDEISMLVLKHIVQSKSKAVYVDLRSGPLFLERMKRDGIDISNIYLIRQSNINTKEISLVELSELITGEMNSGNIGILFLNQLSELILNADKNRVKEVKQFMHYLVNKLHIYEIDGIVLSNPGKDVIGVINLAASLCDDSKIYYI